MDLCGLVYTAEGFFWYCSGHKRPIPVAERSKAWVCSRSPAGIAGLNPAGGMDVCCEFVR